MLSIPPSETPPALMLSSPTRRPNQPLRHTPSMLHDQMLTPTKPQTNHAAALPTSSSSSTANISPSTRTFSVLAEDPRSLLPPSSSWIAVPRITRRQPVRRASSLRLLASGNGSVVPSNKTVRRSPTTNNAARIALLRRDSVIQPITTSDAQQVALKDLAGGSSSSSSSSKPVMNGLISLAGKRIFVKPKMFLCPLQRIGGVVESPYFKYEVQLLHQLYFTSIVEEQVVRHVELLLSTSRPGAMHANLRAAFEWYQGHITRGIPEMTELARRVRVFASYNIYFCKLMGWTDMWLEVSSHTNLSTAQVTKNYCYNPNGILPNYPPAESDDHDLRHVVYSKDDVDIHKMDL